MTRISIVIPTYRRPHALDGCLRSLFADDLTDVSQVLIVVHESDDEGHRIALRWERAQARIRIVHTKEASRSPARNAAIPLCGGNWCYLLDDDVMIPGGTLRALRDAITAHPEAAAIGGPNRMPPGGPLFERCVNEVLSSRLGAWTMRARYTSAREGWVDERSLIACNLAIHTPALCADGFFNEWLDYGEETLLLAVLRRRGHRLWYAPRVAVHHRRRRSWLGFCAQAFHSGVGRIRQTLLMPRSLSPAFLGPPALVALSAATPWLGVRAAAPLALYAAICAAEALRIGWRLKSPAAALWAAALIPSGHVSFGLGMWLFLGVRPWPTFMRRSAGALRRRAADWVVRLSACAPLKALFLLYYRAALRALFAWSSGLTPPLRGLWLRRGFTDSGWTPGSSDIDLAVELPPLEAQEGYAWMRRWHDGYRRLRCFFPILGEVQFATGAEWRRYLSQGDIRSLELPHEAVRVVLNGRPALMAPSSEKSLDAWDAARRAVDAWTEQLHAYVRLAQLCFEEGESPRRTAIHARKSLLDLARYGALLTPRSDRLDETWLARPRSEAALLCRQGMLAEPLERLERGLSRDELQRAIERALMSGAAVLEAAARQVISSLPKAEPLSGRSELTMPRSREHEPFAELCARLVESTDGAVRCAIHDSVYYFLLGVDLPAESRRAAALARALRQARRRTRTMAGTLLPLPPTALKLHLWSPCLEDPLKSLSIAAVLNGSRSGAAASGSSPCLRRHVLSAWNVDETLSAAPPRPLADRLMRESFAHLLIHWRTYGNPERREPDYYRWTYLHSRMMAFRLHQMTGELHPMFPLGSLALRFVERFPGERDWVHARLLNSTGIGAWEDHQDFFGRHLKEAAAYPY